MRIPIVILIADALNFPVNESWLRVWWARSQILTFFILILVIVRITHASPTFFSELRSWIWWAVGIFTSISPIIPKVISVTSTSPGSSGFWVLKLRVGRTWGKILAAWCFRIPVVVNIAFTNPFIIFISVLPLWGWVSRAGEIIAWISPWMEIIILITWDSSIDNSSEWGAWNTVVTNSRMIILADAFSIAPDLINSTIPSADVAWSGSRKSNSAFAVISIVIVVFVFSAIWHALFILPFFIFTADYAFFANKDTSCWSTSLNIATSIGTSSASTSKSVGVDCEGEDFGPVSWEAWSVNEDIIFIFDEGCRDYIECESDVGPVQHIADVNIFDMGHCIGGCFDFQNSCSWVETSFFKREIEGLIFNFDTSNKDFDFVIKVRWDCGEVGGKCELLVSSNTAIILAECID